MITQHPSLPAQSEVERYGRIVARLEKAYTDTEARDIEVRSAYEVFERVVLPYAAAFVKKVLAPLPDSKEAMRAAWHASGMKTVSFHPYEVEYENRCFEQWYAKYAPAPAAAADAGGVGAGWIKVGERLPERLKGQPTSEYVLLDNDDPFCPCEVVFYNYEAEEWVFRDGRGATTPLYWQPLPISPAQKGAPHA